MTFAHPDLGPVTVSPMRPDELAFVLSGWMHSSAWKRRDMLAVIERGSVLVARDDGDLALGWIALDDGKVVHGFTKGGFRGNGVARMLWEASGRPSEHVDGVMKRVVAVLARLRGSNV